MNLNGLIDNMMSKTDQLIALVQKRDEWLYELDEAEGIDPTSDDAWDETAIEDRRHDIVLLNEDIDAMIAEMADEQVNPCEITADATPDNWEVCDEVAAMLGFRRWPTSYEFHMGPARLTRPEDQDERKDVPNDITPDDLGIIRDALEAHAFVSWAYEAGKRNGIGIARDVAPDTRDGHAQANEATEFADGYILARFGIPIRERSYITHWVKQAHREFFYGHLVGTGAVTVA